MERPRLRFNGISTPCDTKCFNLSRHRCSADLNRNRSAKYYSVRCTGSWSPSYSCLRRTKQRQRARCEIVMTVLSGLVLQALSVEGMKSAMLSNLKRYALPRSGRSRWGRRPRYRGDRRRRRGRSLNECFPLFRGICARWENSAEKAKSFQGLEKVNGAQGWTGRIRPCCVDFIAEF